MNNRFVNELFEQVKKELKLKVKDGQFYLKKGMRWNALTDMEVPIIIRSLIPEGKQGQVSSSVVLEVMNLLRQDPNTQISFLDEKVERYVQVENGIFDAEAGVMLDQLDGAEFSYCLNFSYISKGERNMDTFDRFCQTWFPVLTEEKKKCLLEILGYVISDYKYAKKGFFLIGESNSGKSVILELLRMIFPAKKVTAIPLYRLDNRFNLARLASVKINISTELSEKSFNALDVFKMLTSNEMVTAEHKGQKPFEFELRCKTINAGNMLPDLEMLEGMDAVLNRMAILLFTVSIKKEDQDLKLLQKLWAERDSIFSAALDELYDLKNKNFMFLEPEDTQILKKQMDARGHAFEDFINDCCVYDKEGKEHFVTLYKKFQEYCEDNLLDVKMTPTVFSQRLSKHPRICRAKIRISGSKPLWGAKGIRIKNGFEYDNGQDSELYGKTDYIVK